MGKYFYFAYRPHRFFTVTTVTLNQIGIVSPAFLELQWFDIRPGRCQEGSGETDGRTPGVSRRSKCSLPLRPPTSEPRGGLWGEPGEAEKRYVFAGAPFNMQESHGHAERCLCRGHADVRADGAAS